MKLNNLNKNKQFILMAVPFLIALVYSIWSGNELRYPDEHDYHSLAQHIKSGEGFINSDGEPTAFRPPGYPFLISLGYAIYSKPVTAKIVNTIFYLITILCTYHLSQGIKRGAGIISIVLIALFPLFFYLTSLLFPQIVGSALFLLSLYLLITRSRNILCLFVA